MTINEAGMAEEVLLTAQSAMEFSSSELQVPADDVFTVHIADTDGQRTGASEAAIATEASTTSPPTDNLEDIASPQTIASVMPTECGEPEISSEDRSASDIDNRAQGIDSPNPADDPMRTSMNADESNVTSPTIEGVEHANEASQDSVGVIRDEIYDRKAVSDGAATDTEDREDENGSTTPRNLSLASSSARSDDDGDGDAFVPAGAWASTAPAVPEGSPTNRQILDFDLTPLSSRASGEERDENDTHASVDADDNRSQVDDGDGEASIASGFSDPDIEDMYLNS
ncbi:hypothetical protein EIP86_001952 [Pleurotus ostreatoroseus]|nr:hypothetical protein EIP86_001952 [Pleurotus ostreatoroseus]